MLRVTNDIQSSEIIAMLNKNVLPCFFDLQIMYYKNNFIFKKNDL